MSVGATLGVKLLATTHADKHIDNVLPNLLLFMRWQRLEILVTGITEENPISHCFHPATTIIPPQTGPRHLQVQGLADERHFSCAA